MKPKRSNWAPNSSNSTLTSWPDRSGMKLSLTRKQMSIHSFKSLKMEDGPLHRTIKSRDGTWQSRKSTEANRMQMATNLQIWPSNKYGSILADKTMMKFRRKHTAMCSAISSFEWANLQLHWAWETDYSGASLFAHSKNWRMNSNWDTLENCTDHVPNCTGSWWRIASNTKNQASEPLDSDRQMMETKHHPSVISSVASFRKSMNQITWNPNQSLQKT